MSTPRVPLSSQDAIAYVADAGLCLRASEIWRCLISIRCIAHETCILSICQHRPIRRHLAALGIAALQLIGHVKAVVVVSKRIDCLQHVAKHGADAHAEKASDGESERYVLDSDAK